MEKIRFIVISGLLLFVAISGMKTAAAASLSLSPVSGSFQVGATFSVRVAVDSPNASINAVSGVISFPQDRLRITSLSKTGSIVSLYVQEPSFSNEVGTVNFEGIVLNPGFQGNAGRIITVNFQVKAAGSADIVFASGSVLANDGLGTNVLGGFTNANFGLKPAPQGQEAGESTTPSETNPLAPKITSLTHPDPNKWYNDKNPKFTWAVPPGVTDARLLYDKFPQSIPTVIYSPPISEKTLENIPDGVWYFHVQLRDANGWGSVSHFRFQIDTVPPEKFKIRFIDASESENPRPTVLFDTVDTLSGIDYYKLKIGNSDFKPVSADTIKGNPYTLPPQDPGKYNILVQVFDKAGNYETATTEFSIKALNPPTITDYPKSIQYGDSISVKGITYSNSNVEVWIEKDGVLVKKFTAKSDSEGNFIVVDGSSIDPGDYKIWAKVTDARGAGSLPSEKFDLTIRQSNILKFGSLAVSALSVIVSFIGLVVLGLMAFWYGRREVKKLRIRLKRDVQAVEKDVHKDFDILRNSIQTHIRTLERAHSKRELTEEENKILVSLKKDFDRTEKTISGEIEKIEKDLK